MIQLIHDIDSVWKFREHDRKLFVSTGNNPITLPMVRRIMPSMLSDDIIGVVPMGENSGGKILTIRLFGEKSLSL